MPTGLPLVLNVDEATVLRLHTIEDAEREWTFLSKNLAFLGEWVDWATPAYSAADVRRDMSGNLSKYESGDMYAMGIYVEGELVGNVDVRDIVDGETAEVGYLLGQEHTGKGIVTKSVRALMDYVRTKHGVQIFYLNTYANNIASKKVAGRLGFTFQSEHRTANGKVEYCYVKNYE